MYLFRIITFSLVLLTPSLGAQENFDRGLDAYLAGNYEQAYDVWRPLAEAGDTVAMFNIGVLYAQGRGVKKDMREAVDWYRRSAEAGYAPAQFNLGSAYLDGQGVEIDKQRALEWWTKAAAQDHPRSLFNLATLYLQGNGVEVDKNKALALYSRAADQGDARARALVETLSKQVAASPPAEHAAEQPVAATTEKDAATRPEDTDEKSTEQPAEQTAEQTVAQATGEAAASSAEGPAAGGAEPSAEERSENSVAEPPETTSTPDKPMREDWIRRQNPQHVTLQLAVYSNENMVHKFVAQHQLDWRQVAYFRVRRNKLVRFKLIFGVFTDAQQAEAARAALPQAVQRQRPWLRTFAALQAEIASQERTRTGENGDAAAPATNAGVREREVPAEGASAPTWSASEASLLATGQKAFNAQDYTKAIEIWRPLAVRGVPEAQYNLGFMYESGWGLERDPGRAAEWYRFAAEQGFAKAQFNLGVLYMDGRGVDKNKGLGLYWIQSAADRDDQRATDYIKDYHARR